MSTDFVIGYTLGMTVGSMFMPSIISWLAQKLNRTSRAQLDDCL